MPSLPRGTCPACDAKVVVRVNGTAREHAKPLPAVRPPGMYRRRVCAGSGQPVVSETLARIEVLKRVLRYLAAHPDSSARAIGRALDMDGRRIFALLDAAAYEGCCQRSRTGRDAWVWTIEPDGLSLIDDGDGGG